MISAAQAHRLEDVGALMDDGELRSLASYAALVPAEDAIVELGSWAGGSAAWLGAGSREGNGAHITCIDPWADWIDPPADQELVLGSEALAHFLDVTDATLTTALRALSTAVAPMWTKPIGLLFIDALHTYEGCLGDLEDWTPYVAVGGVLIVHDYMTDPTPERLERYWWTEGPTRAVDEFFARESVSWEALGVTDWSWAARRR